MMQSTNYRFSHWKTTPIGWTISLLALSLRRYCRTARRKQEEGILWAKDRIGGEAGLAVLAQMAGWLAKRSRKDPVARELWDCE